MKAARDRSLPSPRSRRATASWDVWGSPRVLGRHPAPGSSLRASRVASYLRVLFRPAGRELSLPRVTLLACAAEPVSAGRIWWFDLARGLPAHLREAHAADLIAAIANGEDEDAWLERELAAAVDAGGRLRPPGERGCPSPQCRRAPAGQWLGAERRSAGYFRTVGIGGPGRRAPGRRDKAPGALVGWLAAV